MSKPSLVALLVTLAALAAAPALAGERPEVDPDGFGTVTITSDGTITRLPPSDALRVLVIAEQIADAARTPTRL